MMQIGDLAVKTGVSTRTIRYYEELGMIEPHERTNGGFRLYSDDQLRRLEIIQGLKSLGFELERIRELFSLKHRVETGGDLARAMMEILDEHQTEIDRKIRHYEEMKQRNALGIQVLASCLCCSTKVFERNCHCCEVYCRQAEIPPLVESAIYTN